MESFIFYFKQGLNHITDLYGLDHMVFIVTLCAVFTIYQWRHLVVLVTAFTIGHTIALALSALNIISINQQLIEILIPITIVLTSIYNIRRKSNSNKGFQANYFLALIFGLIHGLGFSGFFKAMMMGISDQSIIFPLFSFNLGIEAGQIIIVGIFLFLLFLGTTKLGLKHRDWNLYISGAGGGIAITMIINAII